MSRQKYISPARPAARRLIAGLLLLAVIGLTSGCGNHMYHRVHAGETLYSIGWWYGYDYKTLAQWNGIDPPYRIVPGDIIRLTPPATPARSGGAARPLATAPVAMPAASASDGGDDGAAVQIKPLTGYQALPPAQTLATPMPTPTAPSNTTATPTIPSATPAPRDQPSSRPASASPPRAAATPGAATGGNTGEAGAEEAAGSAIQWQWPVHGMILQRFDNSSRLNKGIKVAGREGQEIFAAAPGKIVYTGNALLGYGTLVIIKHNDEFLSAYGHVRRLLVKEGDYIKAGQRIAEMGSTGTNRVMLHFEIRRSGQPVDPLQFLPATNSVN